MRAKSAERQKALHSWYYYYYDERENLSVYYFNTLIHNYFKLNSLCVLLLYTYTF